MTPLLQTWNILYTHVKWFTADTNWQPQPLAKVITPAFWLWLVVTLAALLLSAILNDSIARLGAVRRVHRLLNRLRPYLMLILRVGLGIALLLQLATGTFLAPSFAVHTWWVYALLIVAFLGLLHLRGLAVSGTALALLYMYALSKFGVFHLLDYLFYIGIIYYLFTANSRWSATGLPVLYACTGLSLAWLAMEKMTLAKLACSLMHEYGLPTLGFTVEDFVLISAFIELGLAWAFIVGLMNRFTALLLTGLFLTTTTVFGFTEIVGHTAVHTLLLMFLIDGSEGSRTLYRLHDSPVLRCMFVVVNFCILLFGLMSLYIWMGQPGAALAA
ncbi:MULTISPECIES: hypothetical protein [Paenibacillus]|uniref:hypothetical protein n=1 Tax=Paenibacillus TaxID=44249 RepID=UPI0022B8DCD2|nr:hypothetical protein [Paenibacillus caseinilyticus]MCZ8518266.1 hypothetical protein [Paenibacillus caseinilyticus]